MHKLKTLAAVAWLALLSLAYGSIIVVPLPAELPEVPPGHLPPPGECRIWLPERPPGQQPRPGSCAALAREVPLGGWLLYRAAPDAVMMTAYSTTVAGLVGETAFYDPRTRARLASPPAALPLPAVEVPRGHLPPPGSCKVWFPERPPGQQPPPGACAELSSSVPPGAWLLYRSTPEEVVVTAYHPEVEGLVVTVETFAVRR